MIARIHRAMEERDEGFTLIELLVVIIIIGILAAIAIPVFLSQRNKGYDSQAKSDVRNIATLEETYFTDANHYTETVPADYKPSGGTSTPVVVTYSAVNPTTKTGTQAADGAAGFCASVRSNSGNTYVYLSWAGGLQAAPGACP